MFEDFEFEEKKFNPWDVQSLEEFRYYCCPECPSKNVNKTDFISHASAAHPKSQSTIEVLEDNMNSIKTEEYVENLPFEVEEKFNPWDVKILEEFQYYCCPECPSKYATKSDFVKHAEAIHSHSQSFVESFEEYKAVIKTEKTSSTTESGNVSEPSHINEEKGGYKAYPPMKEASVCLPKLSDAFVRKYTRSANVHKNIRFNCDKCEKSFARKDRLTLHIQSVHENVQYNCDKCDKIFPRNYYLYRHIQTVHKNVRYNCDKCDKSFSRKDHLKHHVQSVHENVRYNCDKCDKSYYDKSTLRKHIQSVHDKVRYNCDKCDKSFSQKNVLKKHIQSAHDNVQYLCDTCQKSFSFKRNYRIHVKKFHENTRTQI